MKKLIIALCVLFSGIANAGFHEQEVTITALKPNSGEYSEVPALQNMIRLYVSGANWGNCSAGSADLSKDDSHILSIVLAAWISGKKVKLTVDDSLPRANASVCRLVSARVY